MVVLFGIFSLVPGIGRSAKASYVMAVNVGCTERDGEHGQVGAGGAGHHEQAPYHQQYHSHPCF
jgi:hypothetical protein